MREVTFWRWIFGLALLPTAAWTWLLRDAHADAHSFDLLLSVVPAYAASLVLVGGLALAWFPMADFLRAAWAFIGWIIGVRPNP